MDTLKAEQITGSKWRVLAIPFAGPFKGKDLDGEYFSPRTDVRPDWFPERPVVFHHAKDQVLGDEDLGTEDDLKLGKEGWWAKVWLDRSNRYWEQVNALLVRGKMYGSSGTMPHFVKKAPDGEILVWPHIEQTLTPTPANPFSIVVAEKAVDHFTSAGIALPDGFADLPDLGPDLASAGGLDPAMARLRRDTALLLARIRTT
jgi:hypothetical protein